MKRITQRDYDAALNRYRAARKEETGKTITSQTAIREIVLAYTKNLVPPTPLHDRVKALEERIHQINMQLALESRQ